MTRVCRLAVRASEVGNVGILEGGGIGGKR